MTSYFHNAATSITEAAPPGTEFDPIPAHTIDADISRLVPLDSLAELVSAQGAIALIDIGDQVRRSCQAGLACPLNPEQLDWLRHLASGSTVADTAQRADTSERTFRRRLTGIYNLLETGNLNNTITHARIRGWI